MAAGEEVELAQEHAPAVLRQEVEVALVDQRVAGERGLAGRADDLVLAGHVAA